MTDDQLLDIISKDVERTFPDIDYFRSEAVQKSLTNILFIYAKLNPDVSYKQGMHELAAPMLWVVAQDSGLSDDIGLFDPEGAEADAFELFGQVMKSAKPWYMSADLKGQPAIVTKSIHIQEDLLKKADPEVYKTLKSNSIEPQIWGIRWIRLLFGREFKFDQMLALWDSMFANPASIDTEEEDDDLELVDYICVVMLLRVRARIIGAEHTDILTALLNYPLDDQTSSTMFCYVTNASYLQRNLSPVGGKYVSDQYSHAVRPLSQEIDIPTPRASSRRGLDGFMDKAKEYSKTMIDQTQKWEVDKIVRQTINNVQTKARAGFAIPVDAARDEALAGMLAAALESLEGITQVPVAALDTIRHVQQCLKDPSIQVSPNSSLASSISATPIASPAAKALGSPIPAAQSRRIRNKVALSPSPPPNLPRMSLSTASRRNTADTVPAPVEPSKTPPSTESTPTKPLFKSPARTSLAQSEFSWMISDVTTPPSNTGFLSSPSASGGGRGSTSKKAPVSSGARPLSSQKTTDLFELS